MNRRLPYGIPDFYRLQDLHLAYSSNMVFKLVDGWRTGSSAEAGIREKLLAGLADRIERGGIPTRRRGTGRFSARSLATAEPGPDHAHGFGGFVWQD